MYKIICLAGALLALGANRLSAQEPLPLDSALSIALRHNPALNAARERADAGRARIRPAGALPDPMLMVGIDNLPLGRETMSEPSNLPDEMTMRTVGLSQTVPYPGKLKARVRVAQSDVTAMEARADADRVMLIRDVKNAYYELMYVTSALGILRETQTLLLNMQRAAEARYVAGAGEQRAVLDARVEASRLSSEAAALEEQRRTLAARVASLIGSDVPVIAAAFALPPTSSLPSLAELQDAAARHNPELREISAQLDARGQETVLARKEALPDFDIAVRYGQRTGRPDMVSASVSVPLPVFKRRKQDALVQAAEAELRGARADLESARNRLRAEVAARFAQLQRVRTQLTIFSQSILPEAQASVESATASFEAGRAELYAVLQRRQQLLTYRTEYQRLLTELAQNVAELEVLVGGEVLK